MKSQKLTFKLTKNSNGALANDIETMLNGSNNMDKLKDTACHNRVIKLKLDEN